MKSSQVGICTVLCSTAGLCTNVCDFIWMLYATGFICGCVCTCTLHYHSIGYISVCWPFRGLCSASSWRVCLLQAFHFYESTNFLYQLLHLCFLSFNWFICSSDKLRWLTGLCWYKKVTGLKQFIFLLCIFMVNLSGSTDSVIVSFQFITVQVCSQATVFERKCRALYMPVQLDDWCGKYLREGRSMKGVLLMSEWDCLVVIKEVAQCHPHPRAVFPSQGQSRAAWRWLGHLGLAQAALPLSSSLHPSAPSGHLKGRLSHFIASHRHDSSSSPSPSIPKLAAAPASSPASWASQQLPDNASTDNRLSCCLQVCQPWACQINVTVNSQGGRGEVWKRVKVVRDGVWMEQGGASWWMGQNGSRVAHNGTLVTYIS